MRKYEWQPIADYLGGTPGTQAELLGVTRRTVLRWKKAGLSRDQAERIADTLKCHPYEMWPAMPADDLVGTDRHRRYYEQNRERMKEASRERYWRDREYELRRARSRYRVNREAMKERERARYWADPERHRERKRQERRRGVA